MVATIFVACVGMRSFMESPNAVTEKSSGDIVPVIELHVRYEVTRRGCPRCVLGKPKQAKTSGRL